MTPKKSLLFSLHNQHLGWMGWGATSEPLNHSFNLLAFNNLYSYEALEPAHNWTTVASPTVRTATVAKKARLV